MSEQQTTSTVVGRFIERHLMPDTVAVTRPMPGTLDPATGEVVAPAPRVLYLGTGGLYPQQDKTASQADGVAPAESRDRYRLLLPLKAAEVQRGDRVVVLEARDAQARGREYDVVSLGEVSSLPVVRLVWLEQRDRTGAP
ncbi:DUF6093 family protein (plasmid) [Streptomyces sp. BI20]|uniref:DUF6093 family protein n=1 Tax=Streptomyces sp. BI20 TaxID=3403460 RepID=UPI003C7506AF